MKSFKCCLCLRCCNSEGLLLRPSRPALPIDKQLIWVTKHCISSQYKQHNTRQRSTIHCSIQADFSVVLNSLLHARYKIVITKATYSNLRLKPANIPRNGLHIWIKYDHFGLCTLTCKWSMFQTNVNYGHYLICLYLLKAHESTVVSYH